MVKVQCPHCSKTIETEGFKELNSLYTTNIPAGWAVQRLKILGDMAESNNLPKWYIEKVRGIERKIHLTT